MILRERTGSKAEKWLLGSGLFSLVLHTAFMSLAYYAGLAERLTSSGESGQVFSDVEVVGLEQVETFQEEAKEAPERADFMSTRNLSTDEETSPELGEHSIVQAPVGQEAPPKRQNEGEVFDGAKPLESFSLSELDKRELNDPLLSGKVSDASLRPSKGYMEKLRRGNDLKVNAFRHDAAGYISRIRRKLQVTWNPQRTITPDMYRRSRVSVLVGITLTGDGELVDLRIVESSFFSEYDEEALRTVRESVPFPNPPEYFVQDDGRVYLAWSFNLMMNNFGLANVE